MGVWANFKVFASEHGCIEIKTQVIRCHPINSFTAAISFACCLFPDAL